MYRRSHAILSRVVTADPRIPLPATRYARGRVIHTSAQQASLRIGTSTPRFAQVEVNNERREPRGSHAARAKAENRATIVPRRGSFHDRVHPPHFWGVNTHDARTAARGRGEGPPLSP